MVASSLPPSQMSSHSGVLILFHTVMCIKGSRPHPDSMKANLDYSVCITNSSPHCPLRKYSAQDPLSRIRLSVCWARSSSSRLALCFAGIQPSCSFLRKAAWWMTFLHVKVPLFYWSFGWEWDAKLEIPSTGF